MNHSYLLNGIRPAKLWSMLLRNGGVSPKYLLRLLFLLNGSLWSEIFYRREQWFYKSALNKPHPGEDPIFIIGNWRTGSTYLQQLLSLDEQLATPTLFQTSVPDSFLTSEKFYRPIISKVLADTRPMDNVKMGFDEPQEDEYALLKLASGTPLEQLIFPNSTDFFLSSQRFSDASKADFTKSFQTLHNRLSMHYRKTLLYKNPFHSYRIGALLELFPKARFIHIYRHPFKVVPSTISMWHTVATQNALKKGWQKPNVEQVASTYKDILTNIRHEAKRIVKGRFAEIQYENLDTNPLQTIKETYHTLDLEYPPSTEQVQRRYIENLKGFKKNKNAITDEDKVLIRSILTDVLPEYFS